MKKNRFKSKLLYFGLLLAIVFSCQNKVKTKEDKKPNILFCIADDATWQHMSAYGCSWVNTPNFDRVANQGLLFMNTYTPNAKCAPSRSCILTGRNSWQLEEAANHLPYFPVKFKTVAEALNENGYKVGYTGKGWAPGKAKTADGKPRNLLVKPYNKVKLVPPTTKISSDDYAANFKQFLAEKSNEEPFFFWYGGYEPHRSYEYGSGIAKGNKKLQQIDSVYSFWPDVETVRTDLLDYAFEIEYFDKQLGKMLKMLEDQNELSNTLIIVTSDNGMPFPRIKGQEFELSNHLPLAMMWADGIKKPGRKVNDFVSFIDLAPTFLNIAMDNNTSGMQPIQGKSLTRYFQDDNIVTAPEDDFVLIGKERHDVGRPNNGGYPIRGIVKGDYLYIKNFESSRWPSGNPETGYMNTDGGATKTYILNKNRKNLGDFYWKENFGLRPNEELYNIKKDAECMKNLAENNEFNTVKQELLTIMTKELTAQKDPRILENGDVFDGYPPSSTPNFYERFMNGEKFKTNWINDSDFETDPAIINYYSNSL